MNTKLFQAIFTPMTTTAWFVLKY